MSAPVPPPAPTPPRPSFGTWLRGVLTRVAVYEPAVLAWGANGGVALIVGTLTPLTGAQTGAITVITTALATIYTAARTRPVAVSAITGALATAATAAAAFGLDLSPTMIAGVVSLVSAGLGLVFRANLTPTATLEAASAPSS